MDRTRLTIALMAGTTLMLVAAPAPSPAQPQRDVCVHIFPPATAPRVSSVDVAIRDCFPNLPQNPPQVLPPGLSFDAVLEVVSDGKRICGTTTRVLIGPALPPNLSKVFRFQVVYTPSPGPSQLSSQLTRGVLYAIRASAQVDDGSPGNNLSAMTVRFAPGGMPSCVVIIPKPPRTKH